MDHSSNNRRRGNQSGQNRTGRTISSGRSSSGNKETSKKTDFGTIIFRVIAVELLVAACLVTYGIIHYAGPVMGNVVDKFFGKNSTASQDPVNNMTMYTEDLPTLAPAQPSSTEPLTEAEPGPVSIRLTALGDNLMQSSCVKSGLTPDGSYSFDRHFSNVRSLLSGSDIGIISQDTVVGGAELGLSSGSSLNAPYELADAMTEAGINVVLTANNHILDKGREGITNMMNCWAERCPDSVLAGINSSVEQKVMPVYIEKEGIKIALLNYTEVSPPDSEVLLAEPYLVNYYDREWLISILEEAKKEADFVIVFPFWGVQDNLSVTPDQEDQAQFLADHGADLIIGSYPHVVEPVKWITAEDGREVLVYYSLGNFQSNQSSLQNMLGAAASVEVTKSPEGTTITDYGLDFLVTHYQADESAEYYNIVTTYLLEDYSEELAARHGLVVSGTDPEFSLAGLQGLSSQILQRCELRQE